MKNTLKYLKEGIKTYNLQIWQQRKYPTWCILWCWFYRKSTSGYIIFAAGGPVTWSSRKHSIVTLSTTEAEYISAAECVNDLKLLKPMLEKLTESTVDAGLFVDNQSAIKLIKSGQISRHSKHIDVKYHYISELLKNGVFSIQYCKSEDQLADKFTKPLTGVKFAKFK